MNYRNFKKNAKALSPVVASIILIAVTVAVSVVVAAWMGGMSIGLMGNAEQATITNLSFTGAGTPANTQIIATVQNTGKAPVTITAGYVDNIDGSFTATGSATIPAAGTETFTLTAGSAYAAGDQVTVKLTTSKGNNLVLTETVPP